MIRRVFLKSVAGAAAALAMPALAKLHASEPMERVGYGIVERYPDFHNETMPRHVKALLDVRADNMAIELDVWPIVQREYLWLPGVRDISDPMGERAAACMKFWIEEPRSKHDARVGAEIKAGGWAVPAGPFYLGRNVHLEFADFRLNGKLERYSRLVTA